MTKNMRVGWKLEPEHRKRLLARFPPAFPDLDADHVTLGNRTAIPPEVEARIIGYISDGMGLEALAVSIDGISDRDDGSIFHITWSLDKAAGRKAIESNELLKRNGFIPITKPITVRLWPAVLD